ncbi:MAG: hypothetical protein JRH00_04250 [Deltaproteobacteria bacterium]|nr:hypothetical protein [Deltaproteobacteria bacterium]
MAKKFQALEKNANLIEQKLSKVRSRRREVEEQLEQTMAAIEEARDNLKTALVSDSEEAGALDQELADLERNRDRDQLLLAGLSEEIQKLELSLAEAKEAMNQAFADAAARWLKKEVVAYDRLADRYLGRTKRLLAAHKLLRDIDCGEVFPSALGPGWSRVARIRAFKLNGFQPQDFERPNLHSGADQLERIRKEIVNI